MKMYCWHIWVLRSVENQMFHIVQRGVAGGVEDPKIAAVLMSWEYHCWCQHDITASLDEVRSGRNLTGTCYHQSDKLTYCMQNGIMVSLNVHIGKAVYLSCSSLFQPLDGFPWFKEDCSYQYKDTVEAMSLFKLLNRMICSKIFVYYVENSITVAEAMFPHCLLILPNAILS